MLSRSKENAVGTSGMDVRNTHYSSDAGACYIVQVLRINATTELVRSFVLCLFVLSA